MSNTSVTIYIAQPSNILRDLSAKLASDDVIAVDNLSYPAKLVFGEFVSPGALFNPGLFQNLFRGIFTYTTNISQ
ncbi:unnamed protein product [marine sediment metagenome]|uniref:Uncharacterized protein n=1 Tax=marine sediment metagenome TaxID=412755 RepID=X0SSB9_9ZZZZ